MKKYLLFPVLTIIALTLQSCSTLERLTRGETPLEQFRRRVDALFADSLFTATTCGIKIVSLENGETLYEREAKTLLRPASNMKLVTSAAALATLGPHFSFKTELYADTASSNDTLLGNIYVRGFGDPDLTSAQLADLLSTLKTKGIAHIGGNVIGDASYFDDERWGTGWMWDDEPSGFAAYNSALSINRNCVEVTVTPAQNAGDTAIVAIDPPTHYVSLLAAATTSPDTAPLTLEISRKFKERLNVITVRGQIPRGSKPQKEELSVWQPEMYFLTQVKEELQRENISFDGKLLLDTIPRSALLLGRHLQPIDSMVVYLNKMSDNLSAENALKSIGAECCGIPGTTLHGISAVKRTLSTFGIDTAKFLMVDGSGVSHYDLLTPELLVSLLRGMYSRKDLFDLYYSSLPNAGVDGLLANRMKGTPAQNNLHAKTGTLGGVSALSGYVTTTDGEMLCFSMMMQNYIGSGEPYRRIQDAIGSLMAGFSRTHSTNGQK
ncbi:MAG TPA: D-alanyl-D-alanine carboxypeptidase/D-alanyl-D-alanine-endopeptidase [Bacteroidota bacterium]|nr:D-alanyl-D-alanine carboxypeptidase/D-alanyl-D-alanine-endopeptidase [Bacteroidota bacterium]